jgi:hypothetical protein
MDSVRVHDRLAGRSRPSLPEIPAESNAVARDESGRRPENARGMSEVRAKSERSESAGEVCGCRGAEVGGGGLSFLSAIAVGDALPIHIVVR